METPDSQRAGAAFARLVRIMVRLRAPDGCPWDREQTYLSLRRYTLEEAYEVVQAIDDGDLGALCGELGDLLLQVVFLAQLASEDGSFEVADAVDSIRSKLERRHPHVFGDITVQDADEVVSNWEAIKRQERGVSSLLDDVPRSLPALERAEKLGKRAAQIGFDWNEPGAVLDKLQEELNELRQAMALEPSERVEQELGDLLLTAASLARHLRLSAEVALRGASAKFERRFRSLEAALEDGSIGSAPADLEAAWQRLKG